MLTERRIRDAKGEARTRFLWDAKAKGLGLRVTPKGAKAFVLSYRAGGRKHIVTLARVEALSLKAARERAARELDGIRDGKADPAERRREARDAPTVADGLDRFFGEYAPARQAIGRLARKTIEEYGYQARGIIRPVLGDLKVADVTRQHVEKMIGPLPRVQRNRVLALTSRAVRFVRVVGVAPAALQPGERRRALPRGCTRPGTDPFGVDGARRGVEPHEREVPGVRRVDPVRRRHGVAHRRGLGDPLGARRLRVEPAHVARDEDGPPRSRPAGGGARHPGPRSACQRLGVHHGAAGPPHVPNRSPSFP